MPSSIWNLSFSENGIANKIDWKDDLNIFNGSEVIDSSVGLCTSQFWGDAVRKKNLIYFRIMSIHIKLFLKYISLSHLSPDRKLCRYLGYKKVMDRSRILRSPFSWILTSLNDEETRICLCGIYILGISYLLFARIFSSISLWSSYLYENGLHPTTSQKTDLYPRISIITLTRAIIGHKAPPNIATPKTTNILLTRRPNKIN